MGQGAVFGISKTARCAFEGIVTVILSEHSVSGALLRPISDSCIDLQGHCSLSDWTGTTLGSEPGTSTPSSWMEQPSDKDGLLLKYQVRSLFSA